MTARLLVSIAVCCFFATLLYGGFPDFAKLPALKQLPDPLVMLDGRRVTTKEQWVNERRPELKKLFQHYMYGKFPPAMKVEAKVEHVDPKALGGKATLKDITLTLGGKHEVHLLLVVPNKRIGPAPVFVGLNFAGNHAALERPRDPAAHDLDVPQPPRRQEQPRHRRRPRQPGRHVVDRADHRPRLRGRHGLLRRHRAGPDRRPQGVQATFDQGKEPDAWGTITAWAWGIQRVLDYLVTEPELDATRIIVVGHSRLGKTALLAGAFDERIAVVMPHQAGWAARRRAAARSANRSSASTPASRTGSTATSSSSTTRRSVCRSISTVWWRCARPGRSCSPTRRKTPGPTRTASSRCCKAADPVYRFLGVGGLEAKSAPALGTWSIAGSVTSSAPANIR